MAAVTSCQSRPDAGAGKALRRDRRTPRLGRLQPGSGPLSLHSLEQKPLLDSSRKYVVSQTLGASAVISGTQ